MNLLDTIRRDLGFDDEASLWAMAASGYKQLRVPKRHANGARNLSLPRRPLRMVQDALRRHLNAQLEVHGAAHGFVSGRSIATAAAVHTAPTVVVSLDLADFYGHVLAKHVRATVGRVLEQRDVDFVLRACLVDGHLPQGAPTSPTLANAALVPLDRRLSSLRVAYGDTHWRYTRFADDLAFSTDTPTSRRDVGWLLERVERAVWLEGQELAVDKSQICRRQQSQRVQGIVVNCPGRLRLPRAFHRSIRASLHNHSHVIECPWTLEQLRSAIGLVQMIEPSKGAAYLSRFAAMAT